MFKDISLDRIKIPVFKDISLDWIKIPVCKGGSLDWMKAKILYIIPLGKGRCVGYL